MLLHQDGGRLSKRSFSCIRQSIQILPDAGFPELVRYRSIPVCPIAQTYNMTVQLPRVHDSQIPAVLSLGGHTLRLYCTEERRALGSECPSSLPPLICLSLRNRSYRWTCPYGPVTVMVSFGPSSLPRVVVLRPMQKRKMRALSVHR